MIYSMYDTAIGQFLFTINNIDDTIPENSIAGAFNDQDHYVDLATKTVVEKPTQPTTNHYWDWTTKSWLLDNQQATASARQQRNSLLSTVDRVNPVWYSTLTADQQQELQQYRTQLLNVPEQSGFPTTIDWPTKPSWL